jgi:hypothetical protein
MRLGLQDVQIAVIQSEAENPRVLLEEMLPDLFLLRRRQAFFRLVGAEIVRVFQ